MKFNVNDEVKIKLTERGLEILEKEDLVSLFDHSKCDEDGWYKVQLWWLMSVFGKHIYLGCNVPFETEIEICEV